jgi:hypothetical protein
MSKHDNRPRKPVKQQRTVTKTEKQKPKTAARKPKTPRKPRVPRHLPFAWLWRMAPRKIGWYSLYLLLLLVTAGAMILSHDFKMECVHLLATLAKQYFSR